MRIKPFIVGLALCGAIAAPSVHADTYPSKPIRIVIGFSAAGSTDTLARFYAQKLGEVLKASVIVENKAGGGQVIAIKTVMASPPDGYTLYLGSGSAFSQGPGVRKDLPYDPLKDLTLIGLVATAPGVIIAAPSLPVRSIAELVKYSNAHPTQLNYGSSGIGSASHLQGEYLISLAGIKMAHIPYKADAEIIREMAAGSVHMGMTPVQGAIAHISSGRVKALAVTGSRRLKGLPDVPSLAESGIKGLAGIDPYTYYGLAGPAGLPPATVNTLNEAINKVSKRPDVAAQLRERQFAEPGTGSPESFRSYIEEDLKKWREFGKVVKLTE
jgi:tripartite-type tricarboxylate transporter receptor subunit TctC